jgi:hypothetical protein
MHAAARIVLGLVVATLLVGVFAIAHGQSVGRVGGVGAFMSPKPAGGGTPANTFRIVTEGNANLVTESSVVIETEAAP